MAAQWTLARYDSSPAYLAFAKIVTDIRWCYSLWGTVEFPSMLNNAQLSRETLAAALEQSVDCVKLLSLDGDILWMNPNGQCAMEIDDFSAVKGRKWASLWPAEAQDIIQQSLADARSGKTVRFDASCPTAKGGERWWNVSVTPMSDDQGALAGFLSISRDITAAEKAKQDLVLAAAEMQHRLSNTLTVIGSLIIGFAKGDAGREAFAAEMQKRLVALNATRNLFAAGKSECRIDTLITALVAPFEGLTNAVTLGGLSSRVIDREQAEAIALVIGELAVNSIKHGALGKSGSVHIEVVDSAGELTVVWSEKLDTAITARSRAGGQGLTLIRAIVAARAGSLEIDWQEYGLVATLAFKA